MKKFLLSIVTFLIAAISYAQVSALDSDPKASESSTVIVGNARFTILTPKLTVLAENGLAVIAR